MCRKAAHTLLLAGALLSSPAAAACPPQHLKTVDRTLAGLATDAAGNVYAADPVAAKVRVFNADLVLLGSWGTDGFLPGQFVYPSGVAVDAQGYVYVTDSRLGVQKFTNTGVFVTGWQAFLCPGDPPLYEYPRPAAVAVDASGNVFVTDQCEVHKYSSSGVLLLSMGSCGTGEGQFSPCGATGIAVDGQGVVYVTDSANSRVLRFTTGGDYLGTLGVPGMTFHRPMTLAADAGGRIHVTDWNSSLHVVTVASDGAEICRWGEDGFDVGQMIDPWGLAAGPGGNLYVSDDQSNRVEKFGDVTTPTLRPTWGSVKILYR